MSWAVDLFFVAQILLGDRVFVHNNVDDSVLPLVIDYFLPFSHLISSVMYLVVLQTHTTIREDDNLLIVLSYLFFGD